jgi:hypothetical protein
LHDQLPDESDLWILGLSGGIDPLGSQGILGSRGSQAEELEVLAALLVTSTGTLSLVSA